MSAYKHILFSYDLTPVGDRLAVQGANWAKMTEATFSIIHVIEPEPAYGFFVPVDVPSQDAVAYAEEKLKNLGAELPVEVSNYSIECGSVKEKVVDTASAIGADLIIVGSHSIHGIADLLGSTANAINNKASCDVLTIRPKD